jgi:hypothetical protein
LFAEKLAEIQASPEMEKAQIPQRKLGRGRQIIAVPGLRIARFAPKCAALMQQ